MSEFYKLVDIIKTLRGPDGCPWDRKQTHKSLTPYLLEETYEVLEAIALAFVVDIKTPYVDLSEPS